MATKDTETRWIIEPKPTLEGEARRLVFKGVGDCPLCGSSGTVLFRMTGADTGIELLGGARCDCVPTKMTGDKLREFPERFRSAWLSSAKPSDLSRMSVPKQQALIDLLKASWRTSYLFWGDPGTGKTHFTSMLYNEAIVEWAFKKWEDPACPVWRVNTPTLLDQFVTKSIEPRAPEPAVTVQMIRNRVRSGQTPRLFLEELDKFKGSEYRLNKLFELVDFVYESRGQIVAT